MNDRWRDLSMHQGEMTITRLMQDRRAKAERELIKLKFLAGPFARSEDLEGDLTKNMGSEEKSAIIAAFESMLDTSTKQDNNPSIQTRSVREITRAKRIFEISLDQVPKDSKPITDDALLDVRMKIAEIAAYDYALGENNAIEEIVEDLKNKPKTIIRRSLKFLGNIISDSLDEQGRPL